MGAAAARDKDIFCYTFISASISGKRDRCIYEFAGGWPTCCDTHPILFFYSLGAGAERKICFFLSNSSEIRGIFLIARVAIRISFLKVAP